MADNITVSIKVRPLINREKDSKLTSQWRIRDNTIALFEGNGEPFVFDNIFDETVRTKALFDRVCKPIILSALNGINGTIFAYGQTSSGKTYTMMGDGNEPGVVPLTATEIFKQIENIKDRQFLIRVGFIEIYNEKIFDLLDRNNTNLKIFETQCGDVSLSYKEVITNCPEQIMQYLEEGNKVKRMGETNMNERSSRSHTIFRITIESRNISDENEAVQISTLNLVDLAGSERADQTGATGSRLKEGSHINKSLLSLSCVIQKLSENADNLKYINYRDSKLTRILQASLGGNAVTSMICNITPAALDESYYTLSFAMRAKTIKNKPIVNEVISEAAMMKRLEREIKRLQEQLKCEQSKNSKIKTLELQNAITMRANQIINSQAHIQFDKLRRRTWCPSSTNIPKPVEHDSRLMPPPPPAFITSSETPSIRPELMNNTNMELLGRKVRSTTPTRQFLSVDSFARNEEFIPGELVDFGERSPRSLARDIHTPSALKNKRRSRRSSTGDSPASFVDYEKRCRELEEELRELQEFTNLEKNTDLAVIKQHLNSGDELRDNLKSQEEQLYSVEERCKDLEIELHQKREQIFGMEKELIVARKERETAIKEAENCRNLQNSVQVEYEIYQQRAKNREKELIESVQEARASGNAKDGEQKQLDSVRKELKQLEVHNYELQLELERCQKKIESLKAVEQEQNDKINKMKDVLDKDVERENTKKLFRVLTKLRVIMSDEGDLLDNTSIDSDELVDSIDGSSFRDSLDRQSPSKIVLTNEDGQTTIIYDNINTVALEIPDELQELNEKVLILEKEKSELIEKLQKYEVENSQHNEKDLLLAKLATKLEQEQHNVIDVKKLLDSKKQELAKLTSEYDELSTQVIDNIQDIDNYKIQIESLETKLSDSYQKVSVLNHNLDTLSVKSSEEIARLQNQINYTDAELKTAREHLALLEEEIEKLKSFKDLYQSAVESNKKLEQLCAISKDEYTQLEIKNLHLIEVESELRENIRSLQLEKDNEKELNTQVEEQQRKINQLVDENHDLTVAVQELSAKIVAFEEQLARDDIDTQQSVESMNDSIKIKLETSLEMIKEEKNHISEALPELEQIEHKVRTLEKDNLTLSQQLSDTLTRNDYLESLCKELEDVQKTAECKMENKINELNKQLEVNESQIAELCDTKLSQEQELQRLKTLIATLESEKSNMENELEQVRIAEKTTISIKSDNINDEASCLLNSEEVCALKKENQQLIENITSVRDEHQKLLEDKRLSEEKCENLCNELSRIITEKEQINENIVLPLKSEIITLNAMINTLKTDIALLNEEKAKLLMKLQTMESEMEESSAIREHLEREVQALKTDLGDLELQLKDYNEKVERYQKQNEEYQQKLHEKSEAIEQNSKEKNELQNKIIQLKDKICQLEYNVNCNSESESKLVKELQCKYDENETLQNENTKLNTEQNILKQEKEQLNSKLENAEKQISALEYNVADLKLELDQIEHINSEKEKVISDMELEINSFKKVIIDKDTEILKQLENMNNLNQDIQKLQTDLKNVQDEFTQKEFQLVQNEKKVIEEKEQLLIHIDDLTHKQENITKQHELIVKSEKEHSNALEQRICEMEQTRQLLGKEIESLNNSKKTQEKEQNELLEKFNHLEQVKQEMQKRLTKLEVVLSAREEQLINVQQELTVKQNELEDVKQKYRKTSCELESIAAEKTNAFSKMVEQINELELNKSNLQEQISQKDIQLGYLEKTQIPSMKSTIEQLITEQQELKGKLLTSAEEICRKSEEIQRLNETSLKEKYNNERLVEQLEQAKHSPPLQPDGRPSLGDSRVAQALRKENEDLLKQLNELQKVHLFKTKQLQDKVEELKHIEIENGQLKDEISTMRHETSFQEKETQIVELREKINHYELVYEETNSKHRSLQRQNDELRAKHQNLVMEMDDLRRIADRDRKFRRQSIHDDRRGGLFNTKDSGCMTDPPSSDCGCLQMDAKIKELKRQLTIKEAHLNTQKMMAAANPLKIDIMELKEKVAYRETEILKLQSELHSLSLAFEQERKQLEKHCGNCSRQQRMRSQRSDKAVLTDPQESDNTMIMELHNQNQKLEENQEELRKLNDKYQQMKRLCRIRNEKIVSLSKDIAEKENESSNANVSVQQELVLLKRQLKESEDKFLQLQRAYQNKFSITKQDKPVQTELSKNDEMEQIRVKYEKYKSMAVTLLEQNKDLEQKLRLT